MKVWVALLFAVLAYGGLEVQSGSRKKLKAFTL